jgi:hypothetical protein
MSRSARRGLPPLLLRSDLTGRVYIVTAYALNEKTGAVIAETKFDATEEFEALAERWAAERAPEPQVIPARATDPETSQAATPRRVDAKNARGQLLDAYSRMTDATDEEAAERAGLSLRSEYAKRCSELREAGYIEPTGGTRLGSSGHRRIVCRITLAGQVALEKARAAA